MTFDLVLAGVGGQGVLSAAGIISETARRYGLHVKQGEVHGMSQRGGAVTATVRMSDVPLQSDLVSRGTADMILAMEPVEALRQLESLSPQGVVVSSTTPFPNVPDYPELPRVLEALRALPRAILVDAGGLAREAGSPHAANVVMVGAAAPFLPLPPRALLRAVEDLFLPKGDKVVGVNRRAFHGGREAAAVQALVGA